MRTVRVAAGSVRSRVGTMDHAPIILFENDELLVVDKPAGLIVHSDGRTVEPTLADWVLSHAPGTREVGEPWVSPQGEVVLRPGIVHRLDRTTSGVMVVAKTQDSYYALKAQFQERSVKKEYRAFVYGHPRAEGGQIEAEIVRIRSTPPRWGVARPHEEKKHRAALTEWHLTLRGSDRKTGAAVSSLTLVPHTGRTHQIRVHLKHLGNPVICDPLYASGQSCLLGFTRPALHAHRLTCTLPDGTRTLFEAPLPSDFEQAERELVPPVA